MALRKKSVRKAKLLVKESSLQAAVSKRQSHEEWAFIYWVKTEDWSVQHLNTVVNSELLKDPERIGEVEHVKEGSEPPPNGWNRYFARVLYIGSNKLTVEYKGLELLQGMKDSNKVSNITADETVMEKEIVDCKRIKLTSSSPSIVKLPKPKEKLAVNESDLTDFKKEKAVEIIYASCSNSTQLSSRDCFLQDENLEQLKTRNNMLQREVKLLKFRVEDLELEKKLLTERNEIYRKGLTTVNVDKFIAGFHDDASSTTDESTESVPVLNTDVKTNILKHITVHQLEMAEAGTTKWTKLTSNLMDASFTRDVLLTSSVSGKGTSKPKLDPSKISSIVAYVFSKHSGKENCTKNSIVSKMGNHLRDLRKSDCSRS